MGAILSDTSPDLENLIARCALGEQGALVALYQSTSAKLFGVILRILKRRAWAEEALQDTYMKVWRYADGYSAVRGAPMTWLINIARNQALDVRRRAEFRMSAIEDEMPETDAAFVAADDPANATAVDCELARLQQCMDGLAEDQRGCLLLAYHEGHTPTELAARLARPVATIKTWLRRGLAQIRECMGS